MLSKQIKIDENNAQSWAIYIHAWYKHIRKSQEKYFWNEI